MNKKCFITFWQQQSACEKVITRDIARTFPEHPRFQRENGQGQVGLYNVLKVYNVKYKKI